MKSIEMTSAGRPSGRVRPGAAAALWRAASGVLAAMPLAMALANRSSVAVLVLCAVLALAASAAEGSLGALGRRAASTLRSPLGIAALAFLAWSLASIAWSEHRGVSSQAFGEFSLAVAAGFVAAIALPGRLSSAAFRLLAVFLLAACALIALEMATGLAVRRAIGLRWNTYIFNRPALTALVLAVPLCAWLAGRGTRGVVAALLVAAVAGAAAVFTDSGAAGLGLAVALPAFAVAWLRPRAAAMALAAGLVVAMATAPVLGVVSDSLIPASLHARLQESHSRERVDIWRSFGAAIAAQPLAGAGFGVSPRMAETAVAAKVPEGQRALLAVGHPHNVAVQIWAELGAVGAALALAAGLLAVRRIVDLPPLPAAASLSLAAAALAVALVGHGAWQGWWAAALGGAVTFMSAISHTRPETRP